MKCTCQFGLVQGGGTGGEPPLPILYQWRHDKCNSQSSHASVYVLGIPQLECNTWKFPCISIILWATQVAICQLKKPGTLGRTEENSVSQKSDLWFLLGVNQCGNNLRGFPNIELHVPSLVLVLTVWIEVSITSYKLFCLEKSNCSNLWSYKRGWICMKVVT